MNITIKTDIIMKQLTLALALGAALLSSCSQSDLTEVATGKTSVNFSINGQSTITRSATTAGTDGTYTTAFVAGDQIGIFASGASAAANVKYTVGSDGVGITGENITINKDGEAKFLSYAPYSAAAEADKVTHNVAVDQQNEDSYNASNFMTAKKENITAANPNVAFTFAPRLALVRVELTGDLGVTTSMVKMNAKTAITWTPSTDAVEATGEAAAITLHKEETADATHAVYTGFVPAQTINGGTKVLEMTVGEKKTYAFTPAANIALTEGKVNKIKVNIAGTTTVTTENIKFSNLAFGGWTNQDITVNDGEVKEEVPAPIELITAEAGTFTSETALTQTTGFQGCKSGWNALIVTKNETTYATIAFDATENAMKLDIKSGGAWFQRNLVYRTPNNAGSLGKYKLTFKVKSTNAKDIVVKIMRGQTKDVFIDNAYFLTGTNGFSGQTLTAATTDAYESKVVDIDFSQIKVGSNAIREATAGDLATGITISFSTNSADDTETYFIKDVKLIEVK